MRAHKDAHTCGCVCVCVISRPRQWRLGGKGECIFYSFPQDTVHAYLLDLIKNQLTYSTHRVPTTTEISRSSTIPPKAIGTNSVTVDASEQTHSETRRV